MLIDHFGAAIILPALGEPWEFGVYMLMRDIGRIAFPIYAYLIAQGCVHTKNIGKYLLRLGLLAIISEPFFDMAFWGGSIDFLNNTNVFYTLFLGAAAIAIHQNARKIFTNGFGDFISIFPLAITMIVAWWLSTDYAHFGVCIIFLIYILNPETRMGRSIALIIGIAVLYYDNISFLIFSSAAVVLVALYNGKLGPNNNVIKWGFYFFYPAHIAVLIAARAFFYSN